jgi:hypothetical protein
MEAPIRDGASLAGDDFYRLPEHSAAFGSRLNGFCINRHALHQQAPAQSDG